MVKKLKSIKCHKEKTIINTLFLPTSKIEGYTSLAYVYVQAVHRFFVITFKLFFPNEFAIRQQIDSNVKESEHLI